MDTSAVEQCKLTLAGLQMKLNTVRKEDRRWHADHDIDEHPNVQYNRTEWISAIEFNIASFDCGQDVSLPKLVEIVQSLADLEKTFASTPPKRSELSKDDDNVNPSTAKKVLSAGVLIAIVLLSLLLVIAVATFILYRRLCGDGYTGSMIPTAATLSDLATFRGVANPQYTNPVYSTPAGEHDGHRDGMGMGGFQRGGKCATLPRSRVVKQPVASASSDSSASSVGSNLTAAGASNLLYAIPFDDTDGAAATSTDADQFVVADGAGEDRTDFFANGSYQA